ncbi:MAG: site-specific integrase [Raineya sp.]|jgi:integrase|nr:site-specific integrase [Raineya sp.]
MKFTFRSELESKPNANGYHTIFVRITQKTQGDQKPILKRVHTDYSVKKSDWVEKSREVVKGGGVKKTHPNASVYNSKINELIYKGEEYAKNNPLATIDEVKAYLDGKDITVKNLLSSYIEGLKLRNPRNWSISTFENIDTLMREIKDFGSLKKIENVDFKHIDIDFLKELDETFYQNLAPATANKKIEMLNSIINLAKDEDVLEESYNPTKKWRFRPEPQTIKTFLTEEDILKLEEATLTSPLSDARNFFIMQFYLAGKRVSDVLLMKFTSITDKNFRPINIEQIREVEARYTHYVYKQFENHPRLHSVKLPMVAKEIILHYYQTRKNNVFVFPFLEDSLESDKYGTAKLKNQIESKTTIINKNLKKIAKLLELPNFSTHTARRSFAQISRNLNVSDLDIKDALGHSDIKITQGYLDSTDYSGIDRALESVEKKMKNK